MNYKTPSTSLPFMTTKHATASRSSTALIIQKSSEESHVSCVDGAGSKSSVTEVTSRDIASVYFL
jgi:hypothetical protein